MQISAFYCRAYEKADCAIFSRLVGRSVSLKIGSRGLFEIRPLFLTFPHFPLCHWFLHWMLRRLKNIAWIKCKGEMCDAYGFFRKEQFFDICIFLSFFPRNLPWEISCHTILKVIEGWSIANVHNCPSLTIGIRKHGTNDAMMKPLVSLIKSECLEKSQ